MSNSVQFFVPGLPKPAGSKRAFIVRGAGKRDRVAVTDASGKAGKDWRGDVRHAATKVLRPLAWSNRGVALVLWLVFWLPRPTGHRGKRGLRPGAPSHPVTRPDVLKLARAVEDACTSILWADDAQIVHEHLSKSYADGSQTVGVAIRVRGLT